MLNTSRRSFLAGAAAVAAIPPGRRTKPDLVLHNGRLWTVDDALPEAEFVAVAGDRILAIGSSAAMLALAVPGTRKIDLGGNRVTPGFNDAHSHPGLSGAQHLLYVACDKDSLDEIKTALRERARTAPAGEWLNGFLYDDSKTARPLTRDDLDEAVPDLPVMVQHRGGHTCFVNSAAYKRIGVAESTVDPPNGRFFRDAAGRLNGRVAEHAADPFYAAAVRPFTPDEYRKGVALICKMFLRKGVTSASDAAVWPEMWQSYVDARDQGDLTLRIYAHILDQSLPKMIAAGVRTGFGDNKVRIGGQKQFIDGSISERTAWLSKPYLDMDGRFNGLPTMTREAFYAGARTAHLAGWQLAVHANGDLAIDRALGVFEQLRKESPRRDPRFRIEHCTLINDALIARMKAAGVIPVPFAGYASFHSGVMHFYGAERAEHMFAQRSFIDAGLNPPSASDYTASPCDPMLWLRSQVTRADARGKVWGASQRIGVKDAIRCGTANGARASFEEREKGSLSPGMLADLVVWDRDMLDADPSEFVTIAPERVMAGGRWVYES